MNEVQDTRSLLQDRLNPIAVQFGNVIDRNVMVFLYPAIAERDPGYIKYHGMPIAEEEDMAVIEDLSGRFSAELTRIRDKSGTIDELIGEMQRLERIWNDALNNSISFKVCKSALDRSLYQVLKHATVQVAVWKDIQAEPSIECAIRNQALPTLVDHVMLYSRFKEYPNPSSFERFKSCYEKSPLQKSLGFETNSTLVSTPNYPVEDSPLLIAREYLFRDGYVSANTIQAYLCEACYFHFTKANAEPVSRNVIDLMWQVHLPIEVLGQYRGSFCWNSSPPRTAEERHRQTRLSSSLHRHFQAIASQGVERAILEVFAHEMRHFLTSGAKTQETRAHGLAKIFSGLFWSTEVECKRTPEPVVSASARF